MAVPSLGEPGSAVAQRRIAEALDKLQSRKEPRSFTVSADFGSTPATTAIQRVRGLTWITSEHRIVLNAISPSDAQAGLRAGVSDIAPGDGFTVTMYSTSNLTGSHSMACIAL